MNIDKIPQMWYFDTTSHIPCLGYSSYHDHGILYIIMIS